MTENVIIKVTANRLVIGNGNYRRNATVEINKYRAEQLVAGNCAVILGSDSLDSEAKLLAAKAAEAAEAAEKAKADALEASTAAETAAAEKAKALKVQTASASASATTATAKTKAN